MATTSTTDDAVEIPPVGRYAIDRRASTVTFKSRHLFGLAPVHGTMAIRDGLVDIADPLTGSSVQVEIDTTSFETGSSQRNRDVRSPRFLDAGRYPTMTFTSQRLDRSDGRWTLDGTLMVRDVARPVSLAIERSTVSPGRPTSFVVCATTRIDRTDFGLTAAKGLAGRHVDVSLRIQGCANDHQPSDGDWLTRTECRHRAAAALVALAIWALARVLGVEPTVGKDDQASLVGAADVLVTVLLAVGVVLIAGFNQYVKTPE